MNKNQHKVKEFIKDNNLSTSIEVRLIDLVSEVGELSKEIITGSSYGKSEYSQTSETKSELGDVFFSLIELANLLDVDIDEALDSVLIKYADRISTKDTPASK